MNKIYATLILLATTIGLCITENVYIGYSTSNAKNQIVSIQKSVQNNNFTAALESTKKLKNTWENYRNILGIFCDHRNIDEVGEYIDLIEMSLSKSEFDETFWSESTKAFLKLDDINENQEVNLVNIL